MMPYASDRQRRYFNANREELESKGVDVDEWNDSTRGKKLPEKVKDGQKVQGAKRPASKAASFLAHSRSLMDGTISLSVNGPSCDLLHEVGTIGRASAPQLHVKRAANMLPQQQITAQTTANTSPATPGAVNSATGAATAGFRR
jgi:hypothetical protein